jgi:hypothetical protein
MNVRLFFATLLTVVACSSSGGDEAVEARAVPATQSPAARAMRLPLMRLASVAPLAPGAVATTLRVQVMFAGTPPADTTVQARSSDPACGETFVDTAVVRNGPAVVGALVWVERPTTVYNTLSGSEYRPTVTLETCRLQPRLQIAAPGSTLQLVTHDARVESLVVVPSSQTVPIDTVSFNTDGQLVPLRHRADSAGVLGIYATRLPWARAFVAIAPTGVAATTDFQGATTFSVDRAATKVVVRAWHPSLGVVTGTIDLTKAGATPTLTLTFKR